MNYTKEQKYELALKGYQNAYTPYSNFNVGAVVFLKNGMYFIGANIENASYGLCNCAERTALFATYANGYRQNDIEEIVILGNAKTGFASPCGACRQVMSELMPQDAKVTLFNLKGESVEYRVSDLLPFAFGSGDLHEQK